MAKSGSRSHVDHEVVVFVIIAGAVGCAAWDAYEEGGAVAGQSAPAAAAAAPVRPATRPPIAAASASAAAPASVVLARLVH